MAMRVMRQRLRHRQVLEHGMRSLFFRITNPRTMQPQARLQPPSTVTAAVLSGSCSGARQSAAASTGSGPMPSCMSATAKRRRRCRGFALPPMAMINVDFASPSLVLGIALIGCGVALLQVRNIQREVSRDADIVVAAMISIVGSTLIFQGWRLDPLLLLCQALTTSVALWYGLEAFKLRSQVVEEEEAAPRPPQLPPLEGYGNQMNDPGTESYTRATRTGYLPPAADRPLPPWQQQQQQQPPRQQQGSSRWGLPAAEPGMQFDSYSTPVAYPEQQQLLQQPRQQGLGEYMAQQLPPYQQQQAPGFSSSSSSTYTPSGYDGPAAVGGMYGQEAQQQYNILPQLGQSAQLQYNQQWYDAGPANTPLSLYEQQQQLPPDNGLAAQQQYGPANTIAAGFLPDGSSYEAGSEGAAVSLPSGAGQQRQQQRRAPSGSSVGNQAYERVDDWE